MLSELPFQYHDVVKMETGDGPRQGSIVTVNHDDPDNVIYLVDFDEPLHQADGDGDFTIKTTWVSVDHLELVQRAADRADEIRAQMVELAAGPITDDAVAELARLRRIYDKVSGAREDEARRQRMAMLLNGTGISHPDLDEDRGPGHD